MFGLSKKEAAPVQAAPLYTAYPTTPLSGPATPTSGLAPASQEPDWTQMGVFHQAPAHAYTAVAEAAGADFSQPRPIAPVSEASSDAPAVEEAPTEAETSMIPTRYLQDRVRSGVTITAEGDLIIHGEVSSGAEIIAGGNVHILGTCKGRIYAGAAMGGREANPQARIFVYRCQAELVSIGGHYQCFEHMPVALDNHAVVFSLNGEQLVAVPLV